MTAEERQHQREAGQPRLLARGGQGRPDRQRQPERREGADAGRPEAIPLQRLRGAEHKLAEAVRRRDQPVQRAAGRAPRQVRRADDQHQDAAGRAGEDRQAEGAPQPVQVRGVVHDQPVEDDRRQQPVQADAALERAGGDQHADHAAGREQADRHAERRRRQQLAGPRPAHEPRQHQQPGRPGDTGRADQQQRAPAARCTTAPAPATRSAAPLSASRARSAATWIGARGAGSASAPPPGGLAWASVIGRRPAPASQPSEADAPSIPPVDWERAGPRGLTRAGRGASAGPRRPGRSARAGAGPRRGRHRRRRRAARRQSPSSSAGASGQRIPSTRTTWGCGVGWVCSSALWSTSRSFSPGRGPVTTIGMSISGRRPRSRIIRRARSSDVDLLAHVQQEDVAAAGEAGGLDDQAGGLRDAHEVARHGRDR